MNKRELHDLLRENLSLEVSVKPEGYGGIKVKVTLLFDGEVIDFDSEYAYIEEGADE